MYLLPPTQVDQWGPVVMPLLMKAWDRTNVGNFWTKKALLQGLTSGHQHCFISPDKKYAGVFETRGYPTGARVLYFWLSGGEMPSGGWEAVDEFLKEVASIFGCQYIQLEGRVGWKKLAEPLGYKVDSLVLIKEVTDESLPIS